MVFAARDILLGGIRFTAREAATLTSGVRQGLGVRELRDIFRGQFNRGLPSESFTAVRRTLTEAELAGIRLARLQPGHRLGIRNIPRVQVRQRRGRFIFTSRVTARIRETGELRERFVRFVSNERPSLDLFRSEVERIIALGIDQPESDMDIETLGEIHVSEQVEV